MFSATLYILYIAHFKYYTYVCFIRKEYETYKLTADKSVLSLYGRFGVGIGNNVAYLGIILFSVLLLGTHSTTGLSVLGAHFVHAHQVGGEVTLTVCGRASLLSPGPSAVSLFLETGSYHRALAGLRLCGEQGDVGVRDLPAGMNGMHQHSQLLQSFSVINYL